KGEAAHRLLEHGRVVMPRYPEKPHQALRTGLDQGLERTARAENALQIAPGTEVMQLPEIEVGRPHAPQALFQEPERTVPRAVVRLGRYEDLGAPLPQGCSIIIETAGV